MNEFTRHEAKCAETIAKQVKQLATEIVKRYAEPQDQAAAAVALLRLVTELLQQEK